MKTFIESFEKGDLQHALEGILFSSAEDEFLSILFNYAHAMAFEDYRLLTCPGIALKRRIEEDPLLLADWEACLPWIELHHQIVHFASSCSESDQKLQRQFLGKWRPALETLLQCERHRVLFSISEQEAFLDTLSGEFSSCFSAHFRYSQQLIRFFKDKESLAKSLNYRTQDSSWIDTKRPYFPFINKIHMGDLPEGDLVIFMEATELPWDKLVDRRVLFVFPDLNTLLRSLYFKECVKYLGTDQYPILVLDHYAIPQWHAQKCPENFSLATPVYLREKKLPMLQAVHDCLDKIPEKYWEVTHEADKLHYLGRRVSLQHKMERLGPSRYHVLYQNEITEKYTSLYYQEDRNDLDASIGFSWKELCGVIHRKPALRRINNKPTIAHIVPLLSEEINHAPSRRLETLLSCYNSSSYNVIVCSSEQRILRIEEYPTSYYQISSHAKAPHMIQSLESKGIPIYIDEHATHEMDVILHLSKVLRDHKVDIAFFHEPVSIHMRLASMCDVPLGVLFEHGMMPREHPFDAVILSHKEECHLWRGDNYGLDKYVEKMVSTIPISKEELGLTSKDLILATLCSRVDTRLSVPFCEAVAKILQKCPRAYYISIGIIQDEKAKRDVFEYYKVDHRVRFFGFTSTPQRILPMVDVYLNEFPIGGSSSVLEAMAYGCPILAMYHPRGEMVNTRSGAYFFGKEYAAKTTQEYIEKGIELLHSPELRRTWREHALKRNILFSDRNTFRSSYLQLIEDLVRSRNKRGM